MTAKIKSGLSLEDKLLMSCARINLDGRAKNSLEEALRGNLNWPYILGESAAEGVACLVYNNLLPFKDRVPENIWSGFEGIYYANTYRNIGIYRGMGTVLSSLNENGLKAIPLKGVFLAEKVYGNIALREMADVDLLVKKEDLAKVDRALAGLGYRMVVRKSLAERAMDKGYLNSVDYFKTDRNLPYLHIHWHIVNVTLPTHMYSRNIKMDKFFELAIPAKIADTETFQLTPHHLLMHLAEHALKHSFDRLILLSDIDAVIRRYAEEINWDRLIEETREFGMERQLYYGLYFTDHFLSTDIPGHVLSRLKPRKIGFLERRFSNAVSNGGGGQILCYVVYLDMAGGIINKFRFLLRTLFPPPSVLALTLNIDKPRVTLKDYLTFLNRQFSYLMRAFGKILSIKHPASYKIKALPR